MQPWESPVDRAIREAQERGEFDNLPGQGRPLPPINPHDPDWFVRALAQREQLDFTGALPPALALRKEAAAFPESLADLSTQESVRAVLEDFNDRVRRDRLRPAEGPLPPMLAPTVDVEEILGQWRTLKESASAESGMPRRPASPIGRPPDAQGESVDSPGAIRRWWRQRRGRMAR